MCDDCGGSAVSPPRIALSLRFWSKVDKSGECWTWTAALRGSNGYGQFWDDGPVFAHRFSWVMAVGPIPSGMLVLHKCDNPRCVRPEHLFLGTHLDNARDRNAKGRQSRGSFHSAVRKRTKWRTYRGGENVSANISDGHARVIVDMHASGFSQREIGRRFSLSPQFVNRVVRGQRYAAATGVTQCE